MRFKYENIFFINNAYVILIQDYNKLEYNDF